MLTNKFVEISSTPLTAAPRRLPKAFKDTFKRIKEKHNYSTRGAIKQHISLPNLRTQIYGIKIVIYQSSQMWDKSVNVFPNDDLPNISKYAFKKFITKMIINSYH